MPKIPTKAHMRRSELLEDVAETIAQQLIEKHELPEGKAVDIGNVIADFLANHWKGQTIYIPADWHYKTRERDLEIYKTMAVGNAGELAAKFGISMVRVYQIYNRQREYHKKQQ